MFEDRLRLDRNPNMYCAYTVYMGKCVSLGIQAAEKNSLELLEETGILN